MVASHPVPYDRRPHAPAVAASRRWRALALARPQEGQPPWSRAPWSRTSPTRLGVGRPGVGRPRAARASHALESAALEPCEHATPWSRAVPSRTSPLTHAGRTSSPSPQFAAPLRRRSRVWVGETTPWTHSRIGTRKRIHGVEFLPSFNERVFWSLADWSDKDGPHF
jgi:hypothetical protein